MATHLLDHDPPKKIYPERIGDRQYHLEEHKFDIFDDVALWAHNPRLQQALMEEAGVDENEDFETLSEAGLEERLQRSRGYDALKKNIADVGQLEPIYVWRSSEGTKYLALEGATRLTVLRELARRYQGKPEEARWRNVKAKVLPPDFPVEHRVILLARIHVRGPGVRAWGRYIEAKFIHESVVSLNGQKPMFTVVELARHMQKSPSWVSRLKDAYEFALKFVDTVDTPEARGQAIRKFSVLEEISKARLFGTKVKDYDNPEYDQLRDDVFNMVGNDVFKEYRDARFMAEFYDDPEKWAQLKTNEKHIGNKLANEIKVGSTGTRARITALCGQIDRTLERDPTALDEDDLKELKQATRLLESKLADVNPLRLMLQEFTKAVEETSLSAIKTVTSSEYDQFQSALDDFNALLERGKQWE